MRSWPGNLVLVEPAVKRVGGTWKESCHEPIQPPLTYLVGPMLGTSRATMGHSINLTEKHPRSLKGTLSLPSSDKPLISQEMRPPSERTKSTDKALKRKQFFIGREAAALVRAWRSDLVRFWSGREFVARWAPNDNDDHVRAARSGLFAICAGDVMRPHLRCTHALDPRVELRGVERGCPPETGASVSLDTLRVNAANGFSPCFRHQRLISPVRSS